MYSLINEHIDTILDLLDWYSDIQPYVYILQTLRTVDVSKDSNFQRRYSQYWRLNGAGLSQDFRRHYFTTLEELKDGSLDVEFVARLLSQVSSRKDKRPTLQFSFASKLVHVVQPIQPVYDNMVADFYFLAEVKPGELNSRLSKFIDNYRYLEVEYRRVLENHLLEQAIKRFRERLRVGDEYTDQKIIDTLIWKFVSGLRSGQLTRRVLAYS